MYECVKVYEVTATSSRLAYILTNQSWEKNVISGVAVSESFPKCMLVICESEKHPYVYQCPCHEATEEVKRYEIGTASFKTPWRLAANANFAVVMLRNSKEYFHVTKSILVYSLPEFTFQSQVEVAFNPNHVSLHLSLSTDYLLVMDEGRIIVRSLTEDTGLELCEIKCPRPDDNYFSAASFVGNNPREMYVVDCEQTSDDIRICKYTWDGRGTPAFMNTGCVFDKEGGGEWIQHLSVSSEGMIAFIGGMVDVKLYHLD